MVKYGACDYRVQGDVAILTCENPPVNQLSWQLRVGLHRGIEEANKDPSVKAMVLIGGGRTFIAGADIKEFATGGFFKQPTLDKTFLAYEASSIPIIAAIHGTALGGGLETAMVCHYRLATSRSKVGQPEVMIGLLPGAGGTQRLPRLCGPFLAAEFCSSGKHIQAYRALECGIVDRVVDVTKENEYQTLLQAAVDYAHEVMGKPLAPRVIRNMPCEPLDPFFQNQMRTMVKKGARNMIAPELNLDAVFGATTLPFDEGIKNEQKLFNKLATGSQARALQHVFFAQRAVSKVPGIDKNAALPLKKVGIIGCGTMGGGIAMCFAQIGVPVVVKEIKQAYLDRGMKVIEGNWKRKVKKGKMTKKQVKKLMSLITPTTDYADLKDVDMVIEAAFESMQVKEAVFKELDRYCKPSCILASNTSTLDIDKIASFTSRPEKVVGCHFFSPANVMKLLENIRGAKSSQSTLATAMAMGKMIKKVPVMVGNCHGFVGNRMVAPYGLEAQKLVMEGCSPLQVDQAIYKFGMAMGPLAMSDLAGQDVGKKIRMSSGIYYPEKRPQGFFYPFAVADKLVDMGRLGQKTGRGVFDYVKRKPVESGVVMGMIKEERKRLGITPRKYTDEQIVERCLFPLVNEGLKILEEGIAARPLDIDIVYIFGYGFPPYRGGPMHWADEIGMRKIRDKLRAWDSEMPNQPQYQPCALLNTLADKRMKLSKWAKKRGSKL